MCVRIFCLALAILFLDPVESHAQSGEPVDSKHIFSDSNLVCVFQLKKIESYLDDETKEGLAKSHAWVQKMIMLNTDKCEEIVFQLGSKYYPIESKSREYEKTLGFAFRSQQDIPVEEINAFIGVLSLDKYTHMEKEFLMRDGRETTFYFSENSLLISATGRVHSLIESETRSDEHEFTILQNTNKDADLSVQIDFENKSFREYFPKIFRGLKHLEDSNSLKTISINASSATLAIDLEGIHPFVLQVNVSETGNIDELEKALEDFTKAAQQFAVSLQEELAIGAPSQGVKEDAAAFADSFAAWLAEPVVTSDITTVTVKISDTENGKKTLNNFVNMMNSLVEHFGG